MRLSHVQFELSSSPSYPQPPCLSPCPSRCTPSLLLGALPYLLNMYLLHKALLNSDPALFSSKTSAGQGSGQSSISHETEFSGETHLHACIVFVKPLCEQFSLFNGSPGPCVPLAFAMRLLAWLVKFSQENPMQQAQRV